MPTVRIAFFLLAFTAGMFGSRGAFAQKLNPADPHVLEARVVDIFSRSCARAGCHIGPLPQQEMDLSKDRFYAAVVGTPSRERPDLMRVRPGDPEHSYLVKKVRGDADIIGVQMPLIGEKLSAEEVATIEAWVRSIGTVDEARVKATPKSDPMAFAGWQIVNAPTARMPRSGEFLFRISHRFNPKISDGYDALYGLDGSGIIFLSFGYAPTDNFFFSLGRSNAADDVELQLKYRAARQTRYAAMPVNVAFQGSINWITEKIPGKSRFRDDAVKAAGQAVISRAVSDRIGVALVPGMLLNPSSDSHGEDPLFTLGLGGRWQFHHNISLVGEWVPIVTGYIRTTTFGNENRFDSWGGGIEFATSGHIFQIIVTNSVGIATDQYMNGGDLDIRDGDLRFGFNIYRTLSF